MPVEKKWQISGMLTSSALLPWAEVRPYPLLLGPLYSLLFHHHLRPSLFEQKFACNTALLNCREGTPGGNINLQKNYKNLSSSHSALHGKSLKCRKVIYGLLIFWPVHKNSNNLVRVYPSCTTVLLFFSFLCNLKVKSDFDVQTQAKTVQVLRWDTSKLC